MTISIKPFNVFVKKQYLYDMSGESGFIKASVIAITAYSSQTLTFTLLIEGKYIYSNIPIFAIVSSIMVCSSISEESLAHVNCPDTAIDVFTIEHLFEKSPICFFKKENTWLSSEYLLTIDFFNDNQLVHLMLLNNNQIAFVPNHKVNWEGKRELSNYKKSHQTWKI